MERCPVQSQHSWAVKSTVAQSQKTLMTWPHYLRLSDLVPPWTIQPGHVVCAQNLKNVGFIHISALNFTALLFLSEFQEDLSLQYSITLRLQNDFYRSKGNIHFFCREFGENFGGTDLFLCFMVNNYLKPAVDQLSSARRPDTKGNWGQNSLLIHLLKLQEANCV